MARRSFPDLLSGICVGLVVIGLLPGVGRAHQVGGTGFAAPIPLPYLFGGAGVTVAATAVWLSTRDHSSWSFPDTYRVGSVPVVAADGLRWLVQAGFLVCVAAVVVVGFSGRQVAAENFATVFTWSVWFRGLALFAIMVGNPWPVISPWRLVYRGLCWIEGEEIQLRQIPRWIGVWPAVSGFTFLIGILASLTVIPRSPRLTAVIITVYFLVMVGGAVFFGENWFKQADPLGVLYELFSRVSIFQITQTTNGYGVQVRPPWTGCVMPAQTGSIVIFAVSMVYTVTFDGFTNTESYQTALFTVQEVFHTGPLTSFGLYVCGLIAFICLYFSIGLVITYLGTGTTENWFTTTRWFGFSLLPIAAAYEFAHTYPYVIENTGQLIGLIFSFDSELILLNWLSLRMFWASQIVLIVLGHLIAVIAAHAISMAWVDVRSRAIQGHLPLVVLMIGYTLLSLWIISQPLVTS